MSKKKISKKKNVLKVLWNECITFKVLIFIIAYVVLAFINMPFEKWLSLYFEWEKLKDYQEVFMEEITLLVILPLMEIAAVALICFIIYTVAISGGSKSDTDADKTENSGIDSDLSGENAEVIRSLAENANQESADSNLD